MFVGVVDSPYSVLALDTAGRLDRELAALATYVDEVRDLLRGEAQGALLVRAVARVIVTAQQLRAQAHDSAVGPDTDSIELRERALQARMNIVVRALYALKQNEHWVPNDALTGPFRTLRDFNLHVVDHVASIHARWLEQRAPQQALDHQTQRALAYAALDEAEIAFERLSRNRAVRRFLRVGSSNACAALATACRELAAILGVAVAGEEATTATQPPKRAVDRSAS